MKVLMLSLDKTLLGEQVWEVFGRQGDTIERHRQYGSLVDKLNIMVTSPPGYEHVNLSEKVDVYPTNAKSPRGHQAEVFNFAEDMKENVGLDLVVAQDLTAPAALKIKKKLGVPFIVTFHGADFNSPEWQGGIKNKIILSMVKTAVKQADGLRVVSPVMSEYFKVIGVNCPIEVIPTPSDISIFTKPTVVENNKVYSYKDHIKILADGRLEPVKNYPLLFDALNIIKDEIDNVKLFIIGTGAKEEELKTLVKKKKLSHHIVWLGSLSYEQLPTYYQAADIFVLSSDSESLGKVLIQAGAAGKPVVATKTVGAQSIIKNNKTGLLVDVGNSEKLAAAIIKLINDKELRNDLGLAGQDYVLKNYNSEKNIKRFVEFWHKTANMGVTLER